MILLSLLLVLGLERVFVKSDWWRFTFYTNHYHGILTNKGWLSDKTDATTIAIFSLIPAATFVLLTSLMNDFLTFVLQTLVLMVCVGCQALRNTYKCFLNAANRGDLQACSLYTEQLGHCTKFDCDEDFSPKGQGKTFGQHMLWLNYQHYAAVMLWFVAVGAPGALAYVVAREWHDYYCRENRGRADVLRKILLVMDFIPVRITALGLLLVGHFSRALPVWLGYLANMKVRPEILLTRVAAYAEMTGDDTAVQEQDASYEPKLLVKLAKRNIMFLLVVTSVLTLSGSIA